MAILVYFLYLALLCTNISVMSQATYETFNAALQASCVIVINTDHHHYQEIAQPLTFAFSSEPNVSVLSLAVNKYTWNSGKQLAIKASNGWHSHDSKTPMLLYLPKYVKDRKCLLSSSNNFLEYEPHAVAYVGQLDIEQMVEFVNEKCFTFRLPSSHLNIQGLHREHILGGLYHVSEESGAKTFIESIAYPSNASCEIRQNLWFTELAGTTDGSVQEGPGKCGAITTCNKNDDQPVSQLSTSNNCEEIFTELELDEFRDNYLFRSKPFILRGGVNSWRGARKWSIPYLRQLFGNRTVHIKLGEDGNFEGVEPIDQWSSHETFYIPDAVRQQLPFPDLVVVRPAVMNILFSEFLDLMLNVSTGCGSNGKDTECDQQQRSSKVSAYLEYSSIPEYMPELEADISELPFAKGLLYKRHTNAWLSNGDTLGKLHFDPFDNLLCQVRGSKELVLFEPHDNRRLYEGHIQEALLDFNETTGQFVRERLVDSTSMVMSPVDIKQPDLNRFPGVASTNPLRCVIQEGDVLYLPAFWWHEVQSYPTSSSHTASSHTASHRYNMAVNYWYEPFLTKEFPCSDCKLDVNPRYRHLL